METITIEEFKELRATPDVSRIGTFGCRFTSGNRTQKKQCENLKVGDTVFFLNAVYEGLGADGKPQLDMTVKQATVVEDK